MHFSKIKNFLFLILCFLIVTICFAATATNESLTLQANFKGINEAVVSKNPAFSDWKSAWRTFQNGMGMIEYIPSNEDINDWSHLFTVEFFEFRYAANINDWVAQYMQSLHRVCSLGKIIGPQILSGSPDNVVIKWAAQGCGTDNVSSDQIEIARFIKGTAGFHLVRYTLKGNTISDTQQKTMLDMVNSVFLQPS